MGHSWCCETSGWRADCASVFFLPPKIFCLQEDLQHEANQGAVPVVSWPSSELGCLPGSCRDEASFLGCLRLFHFWTRYPGQLKHFSAQFCWYFWFCASASTLLQEGPRSPVHVEQSALDTTPFSKGRVDCRRLRQRQCDRTPPHIVENLLRSTASKLPAPGNKSNTGEDGCSYMAFGS